MNKDEVLHEVLQWEHELDNKPITLIKNQIDYLSHELGNSLNWIVINLILIFIIAGAAIWLNDDFLIGLSIGMYGFIAFLGVIQYFEDSKERSILKKELWRLRGK